MKEITLAELLIMCFCLGRQEKHIKKYDLVSVCFV